MNKTLQKSPYNQHRGRHSHYSLDNIDRTSPIRHAEAAFKQAEEYTQKIISRVNYLQNEEDMMKRKITKKVNEVEKLYNLREEKITSLK